MNGIKNAFMKNTLSKISYLGVKSGIDDMKKQFDYKEYGSAVMLGVKKPVIKSHGSADARTFKNAIKQAIWFLDNNLISSIENEFFNKYARGIKMATIEDKIGYNFKNKAYLMESTYTFFLCKQRHNKIKCNERMEFLGDAVLSIISAKYLFHRFPDMPEGDLSKLRSSLVCTQSLSDFARQISLGNFLFLGKGESNTGSADRPSILENAFEALVLLYLDGGMENAGKNLYFIFLLLLLKPIISILRIIKQLCRK